MLAGWFGDVILSRSDSERQRNLMMFDQCPLPVYYSQIRLNSQRVRVCLQTEDNLIVGIIFFQVAGGECN